MKRLYVFDMDGTLLRDTTACEQIARVTGTTRELYSIEQRFASGEISTREFAREIHSLWGVPDAGTVQQAYELAPKIANIARVVQEVRRRGGISCVITLSPDYFAEQLVRHFGFDHLYASRFPAHSGESLELGEILTPEDKPALTARLCARLGLSFEATVVFGDSPAERPIFQAVRDSVAVNARAEIESIARYRYRGDDLWEAFQLVPA